MAGIQPEGGVPPSQTLNALTNPRLANGCENLWHSIRCNPKFDPVAANAMIAEIINAVNACDTGRGVYNCNRLDNLARAIQCIAEQVLFDCLPQNFPQAGDTCSIEQLVLTTDETGCRRIARYSESSAQLGTTGGCSVYPQGTSIALPPDPTDSNTFYRRAELGQDVTNGTVNEPKLALSRIATMTIDVPCDGTLVEFSVFTNTVVFAPNADGGAGRASFIADRIDGQFRVNPNNQLVSGFPAFTNYERSLEQVLERTLDAGLHTIDFYVIADNNSNNPAQLTATCSPASNSPSFRARVGIQ